MADKHLLPLAGRTALVTGGSRRIGRSIVMALAAAGARVAVHYRSSRASAVELTRRLREKGVDARAIASSLDSEKACQELVDAARAAFGRLDILVNNASSFAKTPLAATTEADLLGQFWPNCIAPVLLTRCFAAQCRRGHVINLLDRRVASNDPDCIAYLLSKKALEAFTSSAALALAPQIQVNAVAPGPVLPPPGKGAGYLKEHGGRIPLGRRIEPAHVASAVVALLGMPSTTGQILFVDGGQHLLGTHSG